MFNCPKCGNSPQFDSLLGLKYHLESYHPQVYPYPSYSSQGIPSSQISLSKNYPMQSNLPTDPSLVYRTSPPYNANERFHENIGRNNHLNVGDSTIYSSHHTLGPIPSNSSPLSLPTSRQIHSLRGFLPLHSVSSPLLASKAINTQLSPHSSSNYHHLSSASNDHKLSDVLDRNMQSKQEMVQMQQVLNQRNHQIVEMKAKLKLAKIEKNRLESERSYMKAELDANETVIHKLEYKLRQRER